MWTWYCELSAAAPSSGMGPAVITHTQVEAWARLRRINLAGIELDWLLDLDNRRAAEYAAREKPGAKSKGGSR